MYGKFRFKTYQPIHFFLKFNPKLSNIIIQTIVTEHINELFKQTRQITKKPEQNTCQELPKHHCKINSNRAYQ